jgi:hypothetical protein
MYMASDLAAGFRKILALRTRVPLSKSGSQKSPKETLSLSLSLSLSQRTGPKATKRDRATERGKSRYQKIRHTKSFKPCRGIHRSTRLKANNTAHHRQY